jgi:hypothetical protein
MMIGAGRDRSATIIGWQITGVSPDLTWVQSPLPFDGAEGFSLLSSSHIAWGQSQVTGGQTVLTGSPVMFGNVSVPTMTAEFSTTFFRFGLPFSASAVPGDSGGAVFQSVNGKWQLAGIMDAVAAPLPGAPPSTVIYGQQTFSADISAYLNDINGVLHPAAPATPASQVNPPVQATANATQATAAPSVASQDLSQLLTTLETVGPHAVSGTADALQDMNGDGFISAMDALLLAHRLSELTPAAAPLAIANLAVVPEPSGAALGVLGLGLVAAARVMLAARRQSMGP